MSNYVRWQQAGGLFFFTVVSYGRRPIFTCPQARVALRDAMKRVRAKLPFDMPACVLLPDHLHCVWALPIGDGDFPQRWRRIKELFTRRYLAAGGSEIRVTVDQRRQGRRGVWQPRYWEHLIRNEEEWYAYRDYIHLNPVKHGYVRDPLDWPWSSVHQHLRMGWLNEDWTASTQISVDVAGE